MVTVMVCERIRAYETDNVVRYYNRGALFAPCNVRIDEHINAACMRFRVSHDVH